MNEVREAIERIGARFDPPRGGFEDLSRRRNRFRARRRIAAGALAATVTVAASLLLVRAFIASTDRPSNALEVAATWPAAAVATPVPTAKGDCPTPTGDSPPPVVLSSTAGPAGSSVDVTGTFETGFLWLQVWWNADGDRIPDKVTPPPWPPTGPDIPFQAARAGLVAKVASVAGRAEAGDCSFQTTFTVPDVHPGTYEVLWVFGAANSPRDENSGYALLTSTVTFEVTE
jgi:hypothetical protein